MKYGYHPDPEINAAVTEERIEAEKIDIEAGNLPSWWQCPECGRSHNRGHFGVIGNHRCMNCGYIGTEGVLAHTRAEVEELVVVGNA